MHDSKLDEGRKGGCVMRRSLVSLLVLSLFITLNPSTAEARGGHGIIGGIARGVGRAAVGVARGAGRVARGAGRVAVGVARGAGRVARGVARGVGRVGVGAGRLLFGRRPFVYYRITSPALWQRLV